MQFPDPTYVKTNGITLAVYEAGPTPGSTEKPTIVMMHGFPELAYSWRHQMAALAEAGYPVLAPDLRGYGRSDRPTDVDAYKMEELAADMTGLLDHYGLEKAVFVGHDWGAILLWSLPFYCPERLLGCGGLSVPFIPNYPVDPIMMFKRAFGEKMYIVQFQEPEHPIKVMETDPAKTMRFFIRRPRTSKQERSVGGGNRNLDLIEMLDKVSEEHWFGENWLSEEDMAVYSEAFTESGFTGPVNFYRNFTSNWEAMKAFQTRDNPPRIHVPALIVTSDKDAACSPKLADGMENYCEHYTRIDLEGHGHWLMSEAPDTINDILLSWLADNF